MKQECEPSPTSDPSTQLKDIFKKIEENSRTFREPPGKKALESQNAEMTSLANSPLFQGSKSNQRINEQLGEIRELVADSQELSLRLAGLIEALSEQARQQAAERVELDRERDQMNSWRNRELLAMNRQSARWARIASAVSCLSLIVVLVMGFLRPSTPTTPPAPAVVSSDANELKATLDRIEERLNRMEKPKAHVTRPKTHRKKRPHRKL